MGALDFDRYAERIGYTGPRKATLDALEGICLAHATHIPFENLDIHLGKRIRLDHASLFEKLVAQKRGGYCFEHNTLLLEMLKTLGFSARAIAARVLGGSVARPRTHMLLLVDVAPRTYIADVGFGGHNLLAPILFEPTEPDAPATRAGRHVVAGESFRVREIPWDGKALAAPPAFELDALAGDDWKPLYRLSLEYTVPMDFEMANWWTSTHPESMFVKSKLVATVRPREGKPPLRTLLFDRELRTFDGGKVDVRPIVSDDAYRTALRETFGIALPDSPPLQW